MKRLHELYDGVKQREKLLRMGYNCNIKENNPCPTRDRERTSNSE
jgi:hypothetical protein